MQYFKNFGISLVIEMEKSKERKASSPNMVNMELENDTVLILYFKSNAVID